MSFSLAQDAWGRLVLIDEFGTSHVGVEPVRAFPISEPGRWISLCDSEGQELILVESLDDLPTETRQTLCDELARREFLPVIRKILKVATDSVPALWEVETDRGATTFTLDGDENIRRLGPNRVLIVDSRGIRYLIEDTRALEPLSRRILEHYL